MSNRSNIPAGMGPGIVVVALTLILIFYGIVVQAARLVYAALLWGPVLLVGLWLLGMVMEWLCRPEDFLKKAHAKGDRWRAREAKKARRLERLIRSGKVKPTPQLQEPVYPEVPPEVPGGRGFEIIEDEDEIDEVEQLSNASGQFLANLNTSDSPQETLPPRSPL